MQSSARGHRRLDPAAKVKNKDKKTQEVTTRLADALEELFEVI